MIQNLNDDVTGDIFISGQTSGVKYSPLIPALSMKMVLVPLNQDTARLLMVQYNLLLL